MASDRYIVAIGGGKMEKKETLPIDREVKGGTGHLTPHALFLPTASYDDWEYWHDFKNIYGNELGCTTEVLYLLDEPPSYEEMKNSVLGADLIYVGGGNTLKMMKRWRHLGVDELILEAYRSGTVCAGLSAGALCWFQYGHSDSMFYYNPEGDWQYIRVRGLEIIPLTLCPHYDGEKRDRYFRQMIRQKGGIGVALDDHCALEIKNEEQYRILTVREEAGAYRLYNKGGQTQQEPIPQEENYRNLDELLDK